MEPWVVPIIAATIGGLFAGAGVMYTVGKQQSNARITREREDHALEMERMTRREQSAVAREKQSDDAELGYVDRLQARIRDLEVDNDRLRQEREHGMDRSLSQASVERDYWRALAMRAEAPLQESNDLAEAAQRRGVVVALATPRTDP